MTNIEFFQAVAANEISAEVIAKAQELVEKDAQDKLKAKERRAKKSAEKSVDPNVAIALGFLGSEPMTCNDLLEKAVEVGMTHGDKALTPQYMATLMRAAIGAGKVVKAEIKVQKNGKSTKAVAYTLA